MAHDVIHNGTHGDGSRSAAQPVNAVLRGARQQLGVDLRDVAETLRIRYVFLQAIEDGRYGDLPGTAYAAGFVRSYAEFLGLDADTMSRRFKEESAAKPPRMEIYLPTPVTEGRVPGGALLLAALVIAGVVYGVWYYLSATDRSIADLVPALPERLVALLESREPPDPATGLPAPATATTTTAAPAPDAAVPAVPPAAAQTPAPAQTPAASTPAPSTAVTASIAPLPAAPAASPAPAANGGARVSAPPPPSPSGVEEEDGETAAQEPTPLSGNGSGNASANGAGGTPAVPTVAAAAEPSADLGPPKRTFGSQNANAHIQIRATQDSWLQVRDGSTEIFTRVLKPGDVYRVPDNRTGLRLRTGNAGGLIPIVGGVAGAPLGGAGQVMRDVAVDSLGARQPH